MKLRCTSCGKGFELFGTEFDPCPECKVGTLVGGHFGKTGQSALYDEMTQYNPDDKITFHDSNNEMDCDGDCDNCLEEPEDPYATDCKGDCDNCFNEPLSSADGDYDNCFANPKDFNESLSSADVSEMEFMLSTLDYNGYDNHHIPEMIILDSLDIFIETFRDRDDEGNILNADEEYI